MAKLKVSQLASICNGLAYGSSDETINKIVVDSRKLEKGDVFVAKKGERVDGHDYIDEVISKGASCIICEKDIQKDIPYIVVEDSFLALQQIAKYYRQSLNIKVIGVTGSVGKTSTKEIIAATLASKYKTYYSKANFNNEVGLPLSIMEIDDEEVAVLEMGIDDFGQMSLLADIARPDIGVITNIGDCHLLQLGNRQGVYKAKSEMFNFLNTDGQVFLNGEDEILKNIKEVNNKPVIHYGLSSDNDVYLDIVSLNALSGSQALAHVEGKKIEIKINMPGKHNVLNAACAIAIGNYLGLSENQLQEGVKSAKAIDGRNKLIKTEKYTLIDDSYNANPHSMKAALDLLNTCQGRRVAILGDMYELGENEIILHKEVGEHAKGKCDLLICVSDLGKYIYEAAKEEGVNALYFASKEDLLKEIDDILQVNDTILIKASHGLHLEEVLNYLS